MMGTTVPSAPVQMEALALLRALGDPKASEAVLKQIEERSAALTKQEEDIKAAGIALADQRKDVAAQLQKVRELDEAKKAHAKVVADHEADVRTFREQRNREIQSHKDAQAALVRQQGILDDAGRDLERKAQAHELAHIDLARREDALRDRMFSVAADKQEAAGLKTLYEKKLAELKALAARLGG